ncbi:Putative ribonuclease H protein At1g65750 [Linum perenne]
MDAQPDYAKSRLAGSKNQLMDTNSHVTSSPSRTDGRKPQRTRVGIAWEPGPPGWTTLNTDGSVQSHSGSAAARGLLRNEAGYCLSAFPFNLGKCSITRAELRGAIICLELAWEAGHRKVVAQVDYQVVISLL